MSSKTTNKRSRESTSVTLIKKPRTIDVDRSQERKEKIEILPEQSESNSAMLEHLTELLLPKLVEIEKNLVEQYQERLSELLQVQFEHFTQVQQEQLTGPEQSYLS